MSVRVRGLLLFALLATASVPFLTGHALLMASEPSAHGDADGISPLEVIALGSLTLASAVPLVGLVLGGTRWLVASRQLHRLRAQTTAVSHGPIAYRRLAGEQVTMFTAGLWRPEIYVSTAAERALTRDAFAAALLHEQAHLRARDGLWLAVIALIEASLWWLPSVRRALDELRLEVEWGADVTALASGARREGLFDAIAAAAAGTRWAAALATLGAAERLRRLAEPDPCLTREPRISPALAGLLMPPVLAHALLWLGLLCLFCLEHYR